MHPHAQGRASTKSSRSPTTALSCGIRAHRRLVKLAPRFFDSAVVNRQILARRAQLQYRHQLEPHLNKIYGFRLISANQLWNRIGIRRAQISTRLLAIDYELGLDERRTPRAGRI